MQLSVKQFVKLKEYQEQYTRELWCEEQQQDFEDQLAALIDEISTVENRLGHLEILKKAFSTNGLLAYKIENLVKELEELVNKYLELVLENS